MSWEDGTASRSASERSYPFLPVDGEGEKESGEDEEQVTFGDENFDGVRREERNLVSCPRESSAVVMNEGSWQETEEQTRGSEIVVVGVLLVVVVGVEDEVTRRSECNPGRGSSPP